MKKQVLVIHGGDSFASYEDYLNFLKKFEVDEEYFINKNKKWKNELSSDLGEEFEVLNPSMPCKWNAKYKEWKIWLEKMMPFLKDDIVLIGHSLGGIFLARYLSENNFSVKISQLHLVAAPFDDESEDYLEEFKITGNLDNVRKQARKIFLYHSKDDNVVAFYELEKYAQSLPEAERMIFKGRGHFNQEHFPEIIENIKKRKM